MNAPAEFLQAIAQQREAGDLPAAIALCEARLSTSADDIFALHALGLLHYQQQDFEAARVNLSRAWGIDPAATPVAMALADTLQAQGRQGDAQDVMRSLSRLRPNDVPLQRHLGGRFFRAGQWQAAAASFDLWCAAAPGDADALISLGSSVQMLGELDRAQALYERALEIAPSRADAWSNLGSLQQGRKDLTAARTAYRKALDLDAANPEAVAGMASVLELEGDSAAARTLLLEHASLAAQNTELALLMAKLERRAGDAKAAEQVLRERLASQSLTRSETSRLEFALGDALDAQHRSAEAFAQFRIANDLKNVRYDASGHSAFVAHIARMHRVAADVAPRAAAVVPAPLFIVGMPRSGTTLIEQMLGCHDAVHAAGERNALPRAVRALVADNSALPYPDVPALTVEQLDTAANAYRAELWSDVGDARYVTDKLPGNFIYLGLLPSLLPGARVIHCQRDPLDVAISLYGRDFAFSALPFAYSLDDIGAYYADYRQLMDHWASIEPLPVLDLRYEDLVANPEQEVRRVCAFLDLEFDTAMLEFHTSRRVAFTASNEQVRQPVYTSSVGRAERYRDELAPLRAMLARADLIDER